LLSILQLRGGANLSADVNTLKQTRYREFVDTFTAENGQTTFALTNGPTDAPITMEINGVCYYETTDFTVDRTNREVTWTNENLTIQEDWSIVIRYGVHTSAGGIQVAGGSGNSGGSSGGYYDDTQIQQSISSLSTRVTTLENRTDSDTVYDDTALATRVSSLETKIGNFTLGKSVPSSAVFTDTVYDDTALATRVSSIENKVGNYSLGKSVPSDAVFTDTVYDDTSLAGRVATLETQVTSILTRLSTLEGYFTNGKANSAAVADSATTATSATTAESATTAATATTANSATTASTANVATVAYAIPTERKVTDTSTRKAIWYES